MDDKRIQYTEYMIGAGHPTKPDTLNRLTLVEHNTDGTHDFTKVAPIEMGVNGGNAHDHSGGGGAPIDHTNLLNAGATTHSQIDTALNRLANTSGTNTGDQSLDHLATKAEVTSGLSGKQATLVSGTNIKKILDKDLLGSGNIDIGHEELNNIGTNSHLDIDVALGRLENTSGTNTGDQSLDHLATTEDLTTAIGEYGVTGGDGHTHTDGDGAPLSHGQLANIGTNSHPSIDNHIASTSNPHGVTAQQVGFGNKSTLDKISEALGQPLWDGGVWPGGGGGGGGENEITYSDAGVIAPPVLTDNGDGSVTLGTGEYVLYTTVNSFPAKRYEISGDTFTLTDNSLNYVKAKHTGVTQQLICDTNETDINHLTVVPIVTIYRKGTTLVRMEWSRFGIGLADKLVNRLIRTRRYDIEPGGFVLGEAATRYVTVTAGTVWTGGKSIIVGAHDSSTDNTNLVVSDGMGGWTYSAITQYNNSQYDDGSGAKTLTDGHYAVNWVIKRFATPTATVCIMLGQDDYSLAEATQATPPELPAELYAMGMIVGRIIVKKGDSTATQIDSAFVRHFGKLAIGNHNELAGLQGGAMGDYNHVTSNQITDIANGAAAYGWGDHANEGYLKSIPTASTTVIGGLKLATNTPQSVAPGSPTATAGRSYPVQKNGSDQMVVNVPWTDTNTTYTAADTTKDGLLKQLPMNGGLMLNGFNAWETKDGLGIKSYHGFVDRVATLSFNNSTRAFTITPSGSFVVYLNGGKYTVNSAKSVTISNTVGTHFITFDASGNISSSTTPWDVLNVTYTLLATVYWDGSKGLIWEERHSYKRNLLEHKQQHDTWGSVYVSGFTPTPTFNNNNTFSFAGGVIRDEDIYHTFPAVTTCMVAYRASGAGSMTFQNSSTSFAVLSGNTPRYDNTGTLTNVTAGKYTISWIFATNGYPTSTNGIVSVLGQSQYDSIDEARNAPLPAIPGIAVAEWKALYRVIIKNNAGSMDVATADPIYQTSTGPIISGSGLTTTSAAMVTFEPYGNITATNVQSAIEQAAEMGGGGGGAGALRTGVAGISRDSGIVNNRWFYTQRPYNNVTFDAVPDANYNVQLTVIAADFAYGNSIGDLVVTNKTTTGFRINNTGVANTIAVSWAIFES